MSRHTLDGFYPKPYADLIDSRGLRRTDDLACRLSIDFSHNRPA